MMILSHTHPGMTGLVFVNVGQPQCCWNTIHAFFFFMASPLAMSLAKFQALFAIHIAFPLLWCLTLYVFPNPPSPTALPS